MILGIGTDLINIDRIEKLYSKYGEKFLNRILSKEEILFSQNFEISRKIKFIAKRFSGKESFSKAIGCGIGRGLNFNDISIINDKLGKPIIILNSKSIAYIETIFNIKYSQLKIDISLSDEKNIAISFVVISKNEVNGVL